MTDTDASVKITPEAGGKPTGNMQASTAGGTYFRKGFGLKSEIQSELASDYTGQLVDMLQAREYTLTAGDLTIRLAKEFGFCYGVERAVDYAYQARKKFPDRTIYLAGEIIHNPHVNSKLQAMGITFLMPKDGRIDFSGVRAEDVVILPAFGVTITDFEILRRIGCEARRELRSRWIHLAHSRQVLPRGNASDGIAGGEVRGRSVLHRPQH